MKLQNFKSELKNKLIKKAPSDVIFELQRHLVPDTSRYITFLTLASAYSNLKADEMSGVLSEKEISIEHNKIVRNLINYIDILEKDEVFDSPLHYIPIIEEVLIVCNSNEEETFEKLFRKLNFKNVTVRAEYKFNDDDKQLIIVFDGRTKNVDELMTEYLKKKESAFLFFLGEYSNVVKENRERVYAANSKIALYARIKELIDYIKTLKIEL